MAYDEPAPRPQLVSVRDAVPEDIPALLVLDDHLHDRYLIPLTAAAQVTHLLAGERHVITGLVALPAGPAFELSRFERDDIAALQSSGSASPLPGGILASITFLLGLSFAYPAYPTGCGRC